MKHTVFVSVGSNIGDGIKNCREAIDRLSSISGISVQEVSSFYKTAPVGNLDQGWFINCAVMLGTSLNPHSILTAFLKTEKEMGRKRVKKWGERLIDIDLLLYDEQVLQSDDLTIPHARMHERAFVLIPLTEISSGLTHPVFKKKISSLLAGVSGQEVFRVKDL